MTVISRTIRRTDTLPLTEKRSIKEKIMSNYKIDTKCIQSGYEPKNGEPRVLPIYQSTTYRYTDADNLGDLFDLKVDGHMYSRISNPTLAAEATPRKTKFIKMSGLTSLPARSKV